MTGRASREDLQELHGLMASLFLKYMREPEQYKVNAFLLGVIRQFLKDNNVSKDHGQTHDLRKSLEELAGIDFPFLPDNQ